MNPYARLVRRLPPTLLNWIYIAVQAGLIVSIVLYSDKPFGQFAYLKL